MSQIDAASALVVEPFDAAEVSNVAARLRDELLVAPKAAFAFVSGSHRDHWPEFCEAVRVDGRVPHVFGCSGSGLVGPGHESEGNSGFSLLFLGGDDIDFHPRTFHQHDLDLADADPDHWRKTAPQDGAEPVAWIVFGHPLKIRIEPWLQSWEKAHPGIPIIGGLAGSTSDFDHIAVFHNEKEIDGILAVGLAGKLEVASMVSQGCRPVGEPLTITHVDRNAVLQLGGKTAYQVLYDLIADMEESQREKARGNLFAGLALTEYLEEFGPGDFLVRNIMQADPTSGAVILGAWPRVGQTMQFQLRDRNAADAELQTMLKKIRAVKSPLAALMFVCNGRGHSFFGEPDHDAAAVEKVLGDCPSAGFFCNGEIGPVVGHNFVHGYSTTMAVLGGIE